MLKMNGIDMVERKSIHTKDLYPEKPYIIGDHTYGEPYVHDWGDGGNLIIGKYSSISINVHILLGGNHYLDRVTTYPFHSLAAERGDIWQEAIDLNSDRWSKGDVVIGNDVWLGLNTTILSGIKIGDGAVVAAGSIVTRDVEPYTVVAGNPAKPIKKRFNDYEIQKLLELAWWNWDDKKVTSNLKLLTSKNIYDLIEKPDAAKRLHINIKAVTPKSLLRLRRRVMNKIKKQYSGSKII